METRNGIVWIWLGLAISLTSGDSILDKDKGCKLPEEWHGKWYQSEYRDDIIEIKNNEISRGTEETGRLGTCLAQPKEDLFIFLNKDKSCVKCVHMHSVHHNVIQLKENRNHPCEHYNNTSHGTPENPIWGSLCSHIPEVITTYYFMFRKDATPIKCPFIGGSYKFSYNKDDSKICADPPSTLDYCSNSSLILLKYQGCPDNSAAQGQTDEVTCIAEWKDGTNYIAASVSRQNPGRETSPVKGFYRCIAYEGVEVEIPASLRTKRGESFRIVGYTLSISPEATCSGLRSISDGEMHLNVSQGSTPCDSSEQDSAKLDANNSSVTTQDSGDLADAKNSSGAVLNSGKLLDTEDSSGTVIYSVSIFLMIILAFLGISA